jgi:hypothetical protein
LYKRGYNLVIDFLSIENYDNYFADILNYALEIAHEERSEIKKVINRAVSYALTACPAIKSTSVAGKHGQAVPNLEKIRINYFTKAKPGIKLQKFLPRGSRIGDIIGGFDKTAKNLRTYTTTELADTLPSGYPKPDEEVLDRMEADRLKPLVVNYVKLNFWDAGFRKYLSGMDPSELKDLIRRFVIPGSDKKQESLFYKEFRRHANMVMTEKDFNDKMWDVFRACDNDDEQGIYTGGDSPCLLSDEELEKPAYTGRIKSRIVDYWETVFPEPRSRDRTFKDFLKGQDNVPLLELAADFTRPYKHNQKNVLFMECQHLYPLVEYKKFDGIMKTIVPRAFQDAKEFFYYTPAELEKRKQEVLDKLTAELIKYYPGPNWEFLNEKKLPELYLLLAPFSLEGSYDFKTPLYTQAAGGREDERIYDLFRKRMNKIGKELYHEQ